VPGRSSRRRFRKRRVGAPKDLEDAIDEAAKSVESTLQILHYELDVVLPTKRQLTSLFNNLIEKGPAGKIPPGYVDHLVLAAGGPRNLTSHGQGPTVREVPEELADASIAAAATAITLLAHYLP
jgi:NAD(P)-dependent dehydrogenase (short-subunit alcohol dehydrogenase family)